MKHLLIMAAVLLLMAGMSCGPGPAVRSDRTNDGAAMPKHIIRTIRQAHCARGPELCTKCRALDKPAICLLDIDPPNQGCEARRTIEVEIGGKREWREFDVVRTFANEAEARRYAAENGISDVDLTE